MRSKLLFIAILSLILSSCTKDKTEDKVKYIDVPSMLIGNWNWDYSCGGYGGVTYTPETTGEARKIELYANGDYKYFVNDVLKSELTFRLVKDKSITGNDSALMMITNTFIPSQSITFRTTDTLILFEECFDCFEHHYSRIK